MIEANEKEIELKDYHLFGLTAIFMSSKVEDPNPIHLEEIIKSAGFGAFTSEMVLRAETEILKTIQFKL